MLVLTADQLTCFSIIFPFARNQDLKILKEVNCWNAAKNKKAVDKKLAFLMSQISKRNANDRVRQRA
jgi:hypothetical protein